MNPRREFTSPCKGEVAERSEAGGGRRWSIGEQCSSISRSNIGLLELPLQTVSDALGRDQSKRDRFQIAADIAADRAAFDAARARACRIKAGHRRAVAADHARLRVDLDAAHGV